MAHQNQKKKFLRKKLYWMEIWNMQLEQFKKLKEGDKGLYFKI